MLTVRLPIVEAYPTTFDESPTGFSAQSIAAGEGLFATHCAACHGAEGHGDGPAGAALKTMPADLTADHVYAHTDGELLWWITHGIAPDVPPFENVLPRRRSGTSSTSSAQMLMQRGFAPSAAGRPRHSQRPIFPPNARTARRHRRKRPIRPCGWSTRYGRSSARARSLDTILG